MGQAAQRKIDGRAIRRAFGPEALDVMVTLQVKVEALEQETKALRANQLELSKTIDAERTFQREQAQKQRAYVDGEDLATRRVMRAFIDRGLVARLRWLLRGR